MKRIGITTVCACSLWLATSCMVTDKQPERLMDPGVSKELADFRQKNFLDVRYDLSFRIPESRNEAVSGVAKLSWKQGKPEPLLIDFRGDSSQIESVLVNGKKVDFQIYNDHLTTASGKIVTQAGRNEAEIVFRANDQSLNRRDEFLYTLLVPDRARTLFPCFDQPNMKARYTLSLDLPRGWTAVANAAVVSEDSLSHPGRKLLVFQETEPLSTYLFSFVAGILEKETFTRENRSINLFHRETDPKKVAQCPEIARQVFDALAWMERYTSVAYPFAKYDLIVLPGFQYGGMEHTGATLYADRSIFLNEHPTLNEELNRSSLIAHETAHMWFGDYVTMAWFDDVWTKEVFANYFASKMVETMYPNINHRLNFLQDYVPAAYSEDRTAGAMPIKQRLANLSDAGLIYSNIVYDKSPVVMEMLVQLLGSDAYHRGIQEYLRQYAYGNATWEGLIQILDKHTDADLASWSHSWVNESGMPELRASVQDKRLVVEQIDPAGKGRHWPQSLKYCLYKEGDTVTVPIEMPLDTTIAVSEVIPVDADYAILPNMDGRGYGYFRLSAQDAESAFRVLNTSDDEVLRGSLLITLFENLLRQALPSEEYISSMLAYLPQEKNKLLYTMALGYIGQAQRLYPADSGMLETALKREIEMQPDLSLRLQAFRLYVSLSRTQASWSYIYNVWEKQQAPAGCSLGENDYQKMALELAIRNPERAQEIVARQEARISNPDRLAEFRFLAPAVSPDRQVRDSVFNALLVAENRRVEPWASSALAYLNHPLREEESVAYIRPALEILQEVQRTGDIFFPTAWLRALLSGHHSEEARKVVEDFFSAHPDYPYLLSNKIRQQADHLYR